MKTRGIRNNNPFNIRYVKSGNTWLGKKLPNTDGEFEQFTSIDYGIRAGIVLFRNYIRRHHLKNVRQFLFRFAPASENDMNAYCDFLFKRGVLLDTETKYLDLNFYAMLRNIAFYESRYYLTDYEIERIVKQFNLY